MSARPILIVEDDDALRQVLADQVASSGLYQSIEAATLTEATQHLESARGAVRTRSFWTSICQMATVAIFAPESASRATQCPSLC